MEYAPQPPIITGIKGRCPRCGEGHLFRQGTFLKIAANCEVCRLNYNFADPADGPAFFSMMVMAFPATGFALWLDMKYDPPVWVHHHQRRVFTGSICHESLAGLRGRARAERWTAFNACSVQDPETLARTPLK